MATASFDGQVRTNGVHVCRVLMDGLLSLPPPNCFPCADYCVGHHLLSDPHTIEGSPSRHLITTNHWLVGSGDPSACSQPTGHNVVVCIINDTW